MDGCATAARLAKREVSSGSSSQRPPSRVWHCGRFRFPNDDAYLLATFFAAHSFQTGIRLLSRYSAAVVARSMIAT